MAKYFYMRVEVSEGAEQDFVGDTFPSFHMKANKLNCSTNPIIFQAARPASRTPPTLQKKKQVLHPNALCVVTSDLPLPSGTRRRHNCAPPPLVP